MLNNTSEKLYEQIKKLTARIESLEAENELYRKVLGSLTKKWYGRLLLKLYSVFVRKG